MRALFRSKSAVPDLDPFAGLAAVLGAASVQVDPYRQARKGVPEVVYAAGKAPRLTLAAVHALLERQPSGRVLVSRASPEAVDILRADLEPSGVTVMVAPNGGTVLASRPDASPPNDSGGVVAMLTAGASDAPAADEAAWVAVANARQWAIVTTTFRTVERQPGKGPAVGEGAEFHIAIEPGQVGACRDPTVFNAGGEEPSVVTDGHGMDGALPSVVSGLVDVPVIGLPTSVGYGLGGGGVAALLSMLQTCAPGLVVVNIDNGVGAGATAALIANRVAAARAKENRAGGRRS